MARKNKKKKTRKSQRGGRSGIDLVVAIQRLNPPEMHWPGYQYMGPFTKLKKRSKRGDPGINRLDKIAKQHDIEYARAKSKQDKWNADRKMVKSIDNLPGKKKLTEKIVRTIIKAKQRLKL